MEHRAFAALIIRLLGFGELVVGVNAIPNALAFFIDPDFVQKTGLAMLVLGASVQVFVPLLIGGLLISFPTMTVVKVLRIEGVEPANAADASLLERVAVSAMGMWFAVQAVIDAVYSFSRWRLYHRMVESQYAGATAPAIGLTEFAGLITAGLQLLLGLWLLLGSRGIVHLLARLRRA
jgi:hypothetical protein